MSRDGLFCDSRQSSTTFVAFIECVNNATLVIIQRYSASSSRSCAMCHCGSASSPKARPSAIRWATNRRWMEKQQPAFSPIDPLPRCRRCCPDSWGLVRTRRLRALKVTLSPLVSLPNPAYCPPASCLLAVQSVDTETDVTSQFSPAGQAVSQAPSRASWAASSAL